MEVSQPVVQLALTKNKFVECKQQRTQQLPVLSLYDIANFKQYYQRLLKKDFSLWRATQCDLARYHFAYEITAKNILFPYTYSSIVYINPKIKTGIGDFLIYDKEQDEVFILKQAADGQKMLRHYPACIDQYHGSYTVIGKICGIYYKEINLEDVY